MARNTYDDETREHAVKLALTVGKAEAARRTGIRPGTIGSWMSRAGVATVASEPIKAAVRQVQANMEQRRAILAETMLRLAEEAAQVELAKIADAPLYHVVGSRTRAIHDHQLLTGAATSRTETITSEAAKTTLTELRERVHA